MTVPLIDLSPNDDVRLASCIDAALREHGFFAITGHGVPQARFDAAFDASRAFFALPQATKERWHIDGWRDRAPRQPHAAAAPQGEQKALGRPGGPLKRGFDPIGWQSLDVGQPPDVKESFYLGVEAIGPNQWPDEALVPGFADACNAWSAAMNVLARRLMALFAQALGLPATHFEPLMTEPTCTTRLLHYPPQPATALQGQIGCGAHTDWGALTLLAQDDAGGLQVQSTNGSWLDIEPIAGALVVNTGDMMQRWTNDRWLSTMHRVINRGRSPGRPKNDPPPRGAGAAGGDLGADMSSGRDRWSIAYFFDMDASARIEPLAVCTGANNPPRYAPLTAGEHLVEMYRRTTVVA